MQRLQICLSIDPDPSVPDALSRHQLTALLKAAMEGTQARMSSIDEDELLRAALSAWADQTKELLQWLESQGDAVSDTRSPKQVMALGSFRTHLVMGLKALRYAESLSRSASAGRFKFQRETHINLFGEIFEFGIHFDQQHG